jgi:hypothetical protein
VDDLWEQEADAPMPSQGEVPRHRIRNVSDLGRHRKDLFPRFLADPRGIVERERYGGL